MMKAISKSDEEQKEYETALSDLKLDEKEVEKACKVTVKGKKNISDEVLDPNDIAFQYKMTLEGKDFMEEEEAYFQTGKAIAGDTFIRLTYGFLRNFSSKSNLVSAKDIDKFNIQFIDSFKKVESIVLRDRSIKEIHSRAVLKHYKDALCNIGDIITNNKGNMEAVFEKYEDKENQDTGLTGM